MVLWETKKKPQRTSPLELFLLEAIVTAVAMPVMVMVAPTVMARAPSMMTVTAPAVPTVPAPAMAMMSTPAMVPTMVMMMVPAPTVLNGNDTGLCRIGQGYGRGKGCCLNDAR